MDGASNGVAAMSNGSRARNISPTRHKGRIEKTRHRQKQSAQQHTRPRQRRIHKTSDGQRHVGKPRGISDERGNVRLIKRIHRRECAEHNGRHRPKKQFPVGILGLHADGRIVRAMRDSVQKNLRLTNFRFPLSAFRFSKTCLCRNSGANSPYGENSSQQSGLTHLKPDAKLL